MSDDTPSHDRHPGGIPGVPHPGAIVALAAGVFTATLLAAFSAEQRSELGGWWAVALGFALLTWLAVALAAWVGKRLMGRSRGSQGDEPAVLVFFWLSVEGGVFLAVVGWLMGLSPLGFVLSALPVLLVCAFFWARRVGVDQKVVGWFAGAVLFLICIRLFTMPGDREGLAPKLAGQQEGDVVMITWNVGGGAPGFSPASDGEIGRIAKAVTEQGAHVVCLQSVPSAGFLDALKVKLGTGWRGQASNGEGNSTAVLSSIGGVFQTPAAQLAHGGPSMVTIASDRGSLNFVSCHAAGGRASAARRQIVEWVLKAARSPKSKTVIAGDFGIDPGRGWNFLRPLLTDSARFDRATWRAINILGSDPGFGGAATSALGRRVDWVVVDSKMAITDYRVLESLRGDGIDHAPVLVRVGLGKAGRKMAEPDAVGAPRGEMLERAL